MFRSRIPTHTSFALPRPVIFLLRFLPALVSLVVLLGTSGCRRQPMSQSGNRPAVVSAPADTIAASRPVTPKPVSADSVVKTPAASSATIDPKTRVAQVDFRYLTAKSKLSFKSPADEIDNATLNIRMQQDSLIWLSVSKLGIEAVRGLITRDSVFILDKLHRTYTASSFHDLSNRFNFTLTFPLLQAMLVGNLPLPGQPAQFISSTNDLTLLRQTDGSVVVENFVSVQNRKLKKLTLTDQATQNTLQLDYDAFTPLNNLLFPYTDQLTLNYKSRTNGQPGAGASAQTTVQVNYSKVELVDKNPGFPFTVPSSYQRQP